jgi:hypothetical protein
MTKANTKNPPKTKSSKSLTIKALERAEAEFDERRAAIESDETKTPAEKRDELLAAASELEWTIRAINERSTP